MTWNIFRGENKDANLDEDRLAHSFASRLLMPEESIKDRVKQSLNDEGQTSLEKLDDIAREFDVSLDALVCRIARLFKIPKEDTEKYLGAAKTLAQTHKPRSSYKPARLPERYCVLAQRALREGKLSLMQFAKYMDMSYRQAREYLTEDEDFKDEKISISVA